MYGNYTNGGQGSLRGGEREMFLCKRDERVSYAMNGKYIFGKFQMGSVVVFVCCE